MFPEMTVHENFRDGRLPAPRRPRRRLRSHLRALPRPQGQAPQPAGDLPAASARWWRWGAPMLDPKLLLLDEPTAGLSPSTWNRSSRSPATCATPVSHPARRAARQAGARLLRPRLRARHRRQPPRGQRTGPASGSRGGRVPRRQGSPGAWLSHWTSQLPHCPASCSARSTRWARSGSRWCSASCASPTSPGDMAGRLRCAGPGHRRAHPLGAAGSRWQRSRSDDRRHFKLF